MQARCNGFFFQMWGEGTHLNLSKTTNSQIVTILILGVGGGDHANTLFACSFSNAETYWTYKHLRLNLSRLKIINITSNQKKISNGFSDA